MQIQLQLMRKRVDRQKTEVLLKRQWEQYLEQGAAARTRTSSQCGLKSTRTMRGHHVGSEATATATESARGAARSSQRPKSDPTRITIPVATTRQAMTATKASSNKKAGVVHCTLHLRRSCRQQSHSHSLLGGETQRK